MADNINSTPKQQGTLVDFASVEKKFGELTAVTDINLKVREGEFLCLLGPSGCGKSTLLNMTAGLFAPSTGKVQYRGKFVTGINNSVGYMTQADHLLPWRTVSKNIAVPLEIAGKSSNETASTIASLIETVGLKGFENSYPSQLSGGMRKRCALARLLAYNPETLLMDEPFGALDAQLRLRLQIELRNLSLRLNKTVIFVTHDVDEAVSLSDRCVVSSARPGTIREIVDIKLPRDRDISALRFDPEYQKECARLWHLLTPELAAQEALGVK
ncbi:ABC transporter ATP-binding protein [Rhizobium sp. J15]|uniref:ABC transporter ATP-binding protein n=1 Tax=Rhizobium sp. J15 TaxID=2035450 RepID=UPI000BE7BD28|nr:ABC transporter ATP-binding protein [Rhizobium sp. J15]PDT16807.1 ABC transporter ATP-binding protein [Rhizobium sp. J15]